jgi:hypothetical protein
MRWTIRICLLAGLAWAIFMVSPFVALYSLGRAVETRDLALLQARVNLRAVRLSLAKQVLSEHLRLHGRTKELEWLGRGTAANAAATIADPLLAELVTPEGLISVFEGRLGPAGTAAIPGGLEISLHSFMQAWRTFIASESRGFAAIVIPVLIERPKEEQYRLHMRLSGTTWQLHGIELPIALVRDLAQRLPRPTG